MSDRITVKSLGGNRIEAGNGTHSVVLDLPKAEGGEGTALGPHETLLSALGGCTAMTLLLYARRKSWPLEGVEAALTREKAPVGDPHGRERYAVDLRLLGPLDDAMRARLLEVAQKCPVYRTLTSDVDVVERLAP
jgi:putative redox protein